MHASVGRWLWFVCSLSTLACGRVSLDAYGSSGSTELTGLAGAPGVAGAGGCGDPYASSSKPFDPCAVDTDCHDAYLFCGPPLSTVTFCRDADAAVDECAPPAFANAPICPAVIFVTANLCGVRYQRPCKVDADCGPRFSCLSSASGTCPAGSPCGRCQAPPPTTCVTKAECPNGWDCYAPCACPGANAQTSCIPPFESFHCPNCAPIPGD